MYIKGLGWCVLRGAGQSYKTDDIGQPLSCSEQWHRQVGPSRLTGEMVGFPGGADNGAALPSR